MDFLFPIFQIILALFVAVATIAASTNRNGFIDACYKKDNY